MSQTSEKTDTIGRLKQAASSTWFAGTLFALLTIIIFNQFFFSGNMLFSSDQMGGLDTKVIMQKSLMTDHEIPSWLPSRLSGMPTIDALFGDAFYLPSLLLTIASPIAKSIGLKMLFHIFLAGLFFYLLLRKGFGMNPLISITGAIFYMFNPQFLSHIYPGHDAKMYVIAWLPFIIWQLKSLMTTPTLLTTSFVGLGIGMSILTSHLQMTYFVLWGAFLYWIIAMALAIYRKESSATTTKKGLYFWGAIALGLGLGAIQIFPSFLYIRDALSVRGVDRGFEFASSWSLHWPEFFSLWVPELVNTLDYYWGQNPFKLNSEYAGMIPLLLSAAAIVIKPRNTWRIFWGAVALGTALFALGAHTPVFHLAYAVIPGVSKFRAASMIMFWFSFSTILLSALFLKDIASGTLQSLPDARKQQLTKVIYCTGGAFLLLTVLFSIQGAVRGIFAEAISSSEKDRIFEINFSRNFVPFLWLWFFFAISVLGMIYFAIRGKLSPATITVILLVIGFIDIIRVDTRFIKLINPKPYFQSEPVITQLAREMRTEPFRCFSLPGGLPQNGEGIHGLEGVGGFHDNELHWYREFRGDQQDRNFLSSLITFDSNGQPFLRSEMLTEGNPFLNLANARYLLVRNGTQLLSFCNKNALDRISFVPDFIILDSAGIPEALNNATYDYRRKVALSVKPPELPELSPDTAIDAVPGNTLETKWLKYTTNFRKAVVNVPKNGFLRIAEVFYPGWRIRIDGNPVNFYRADGTWMAIPVKAGSHTVEMSPHSNYMKPFIPVFLATFSLMSIFWIISAVQHISRRKRSAAK